ncbi:Death on curing protein, Doc toxin [uncultured Candidatus Thioglobus sp.]|nr:Death on curing protein, Doc toxin [uncultured Candidatus Thioglobus sp.]
MEIEWSPLAIERVIELAEYIALDKPDVAMQWASDIFDSTDKLMEHPRSGRIVPEIQEDDYRELIEGSYRIIYLIGVSKISVLTVRHGKQLLSVEDLTS